MAFRKRKRAGSGNIRLSFLCSIIVMIAVGVSYSYLEEGVNIDTQVSTGNLDIQFFQNAQFQDTKGTGQLSFRYEDPHTIWVEGTVQEAAVEVLEENETETIIRPQYTGYDGFLKFAIVNKGSVPAVLTGSVLENESGNVFNDMNNQGFLILPNGENYMNQDLCIRTNAANGACSFDFESELQFSQPK